MKWFARENVLMKFNLTSKNTFILEITDDGKGFDVQKVSSYSNGLQNMRKRAENIGAVYTINSIVGKKTIITITGKINTCL